MGNWVDTVLNKWYQFDISRKVKDLPGENELSWFLGCGTLDYMITYPAYQVFMDSLNFYDIGYDYNYFEGGHVYNAETWIKGLHWIDSIVNHSYQTMGIEIIKQNKNQLMVYPNPVSDQTKIEFTLSDNKSVYFDLHNIAGKVVTSSNFGIISKGKHSVSWDTQDLPSGIYFLRLQVGNEVVTKKIIKL